METKQFDAIIIGGSYAGLSAAMTLGRSKRHVLIIDDNNPCNRQTPHSHNFITQDGEKPAIIKAKALEQVLKYDTVRLQEGTALAGAKTDSGFEITTAAGDIFTADKLVFATGLTDIMPGIKGLAECWGISVLHCPYCHGYEVKDSPLGVISNGELAFEFCRMIHHWSKDLILFTNGKADIAEEHLTAIREHHISIVEEEIKELVHHNGHLDTVVLQNGKEYKLNALFYRAAARQHCNIPEQLGCELGKMGLITVDDLQRTSIPGLYAAGDNSAMFRSVAIATAAGTKAGAMLNKELVEERF